MRLSKPGLDVLGVLDSQPIMHRHTVSLSMSGFAPPQIGGIRVASVTKRAVPSGPSQRLEVKSPLVV